MAKQRELHPNKPPLRLSDTRWACRYGALCVRYDCLLATLEDIADDCSDRPKAVEAKGLYFQVKHF